MMVDMFESHKSEWELYIDKTGLFHHDNTNRSEVFQKMPQNNVMSTLRSPCFVPEVYEYFEISFCFVPEVLLTLEDL